MYYIDVCHRGLLMDSLIFPVHACLSPASCNYRAPLFIPRFNCIVDRIEKGFCAPFALHFEPLMTINSGALHVTVTVGSLISFITGLASLLSLLIQASVSGGGNTGGL